MQFLSGFAKLVIFNSDLALFGFVLFLLLTQMEFFSLRRIKVRCKYEPNST